MNKLNTPGRQDVASRIEHTLLAPDARVADVQRLCQSASELGVRGVCVSPNHLRVTTEFDGLVKVTVCGFPSGAHKAAIKASEAATAIEEGADEIDMVADLGLIADGDFAGLESEVRAVRNAMGSEPELKVIIESALWNANQLADICRALINGGASYVKTSTGFHPAGGASLEAVKLLHEFSGGQMQVKASGGIRSADQCVELIGAGAARLGLSRSADILAELI